MPYSYLNFTQSFSELFALPNPIQETEYDLLAPTLELEVMAWDGIICLPTGSQLDIAGIKNLATALYTAHVVVTTYPAYSPLANDGVRSIESLDNKIAFQDYKFKSAFDLLTTRYGARLKDMLERYSCKRIRDEEYEALTKVHEFAGIGESLGGCCDEDFSFGVIW
jgi:hypothetical protein